MFRFGRILAPVTAVLALLASAVLLMPQGASGNDAHSSASSVAQRGSVHRFGHDVSITKALDGDVQVMAGNATVSAPIHGDLYLLAGNAVLQPGGHVDGDVICFGGRFEGDPATVHGRIYAPGYTTPLSLIAEGPGTRSRPLLTVAVKLSLLFVWLVATIAVTLASGREVRLASAEVRVSPFHSFALGLVAFMSFVLTAIVCSYLIPFVIGIPLLAALAAFAFLTKVFGVVAVCHAVGTLVAGSRSREELERRRWLRGDVAMVMVGLLILGAVRMIPVVGTIVWMAASIFGVGTALGTKFGRREPWFLVWHTANG
jgi:hypothetical protein